MVVKGYSSLSPLFTHFFIERHRNTPFFRYGDIRCIAIKDTNI